MTLITALIVFTAAIVSAAPASAQVYKLTAPDGTTFYTNAPSSPGYKRLPGYGSGTQAGWLRVPNGDPARYHPEITNASLRYGVSDKLVVAVIRAESAFNPQAVSRKGAQGLMQLMPGTASVLGVRNSFDPGQNIDGGVRHLRGLIDRFGNNLPLAIAAYNAGERAVLTHGGIPPYPETQDYVTKVLRYYDGAKFGASTPVYRTVADDGTVIYTNIPPRGRR